MESGRVTGSTLLHYSGLDKRHFIRTEACRCWPCLLAALTLCVGGSYAAAGNWPFCSETEGCHGCSPLPLWDYALLVTLVTNLTCLPTFRALIKWNKEEFCGVPGQGNAHFKNNGDEDPLICEFKSSEVTRFHLTFTVIPFFKTLCLRETWLLQSKKQIRGMQICQLNANFSATRTIVCQSCII